MSLNASALAASERLQALQRGQQPVRGLVERGEVDRGREDVVRGLAHVHVVVGVHAVAGQRGDDLVGVHVRRRARSRSGRRRSGTGRRASPAGDLVPRGGDPLRDVGVQQPELGVDARGGALDPAQLAHDRDRHALARDREVRDGLGGLAAPQLLGGILHAHGLASGIRVRREPSARRARGASLPPACTACGSSSSRQCAHTSIGIGEMAAGVAQDDRRVAPRTGARRPSA